MSKKIYYILFTFSYFITCAQDVEVLKVIYENKLNYKSLYAKNTINHDEIDTSKNISLITNEDYISKLSKDINSKCLILSNDDIIVSSDFILSSNLNIKSKLKEVKPHMKNYLNKLIINQKVINKKKDYIFYNNELRNVIVIMLKMSRSYYNKHTSNLNICGNPDDKILVYRFLNGNDEYEIENDSF